MTRAADRLIVCGAEASAAAGGLLVEPGRDALAAGFGRGTGRRRRRQGAGAIARRRRRRRRRRHRRPRRRHASERPRWLDREAPSEPLALLPLSPSRAYDDEPAPVRASSAGGRAERRNALARGVLVHRLLQSLPDIPRAARAEAARRHLARAAEDFSAEEREPCSDRCGVCSTIRASPRCSRRQPRRSADRRPPAQGGAIAVSGQVDRLAVTADAVLIADYKTNRPAPRALEEVPPAYIRAARALPRRARPALSRTSRPRRADLDRCA